MEKETALRLLSGMTGTQNVPHGSLIKALLNTDVPRNSFCVTFHNVSEYGKKTGALQKRGIELELGALFRNHDAEKYCVPKLRVFYEDVILTNWELYYPVSIEKILCFSNSKYLARDISSRKAILKLMGQSEEEYSLLGILRTTSADNPHNKHLRMTKPILYVPGAKNRASIYKWENAGTKYEIENSNFFSSFESIRLQEYQSMMNPVAQHPKNGFIKDIGLVLMAGYARISKTAGLASNIAFPVCSDTTPNASMYSIAKTITNRGIQ